MFPLRLCLGKLLVAVTRERRYGPSRLRVNDDDDDDLFSTVNELNYLYIHTYHTTLQTFNDPYSGTTRVSRYRKGKTNLDFTELSEWQWHQLGHIQVCTSLQTDNHAS